jgi:hypothetical protein
MADSTELHGATAGLAALSICESLLLALSDAAGLKQAMIDDPATLKRLAGVWTSRST